MENHTLEQTIIVIKVEYKITNRKIRKNILSIIFPVLKILITKFSFSICINHYLISNLKPCIKEPQYQKNKTNRINLR